ncbi:MAG: THUMP domain-containing class I SAM-dependent RNA methyltransferase [Anaerolineales bacterium]
MKTDAHGLKLFAVCAPGLEPYAERELWALNVKDVRAVVGGVEFTGMLADVYRANLHLRTASRVLVRLGHFRATAFWELEKRSSQLEWESYLTPGQPVAVRATCHKSKLYHSDGVAQRIVTAISQRLGRPSRHLKNHPDAETYEAQLIVVRLDHDQCSISIDSSGELLHRRGYRLATAKAPLRETLAAGMLMAAGWDAASPLIDPFCGAGTIAIEAALLALNAPPGRARRFAFMEWPGFDPMSVEALRASSLPTPPRIPSIVASDRDAGAIEAARANAERAGVANHIEFVRRAVSDLQAPAGRGWVVTNPPYGVRVSSRARGRDDLRNLYARFGEVLRERCAGWRVALLCAETTLAHHTRLKFDRSPSFVNGGLNVKLWCGEVESSS